MKLNRYTIGAVALKQKTCSVRSITEDTIRSISVQSAVRTRVLPGWLGWAGLVASLAALLRFLGPLGGWLSLLWIVVVCVLMLSGAVGHTITRRS
jgi:hypothetical protein